MDGLPGVFVDQGFEGVRDDQVGIMQLAVIDGVGEKILVRIEAAKEMRGALDLSIGGVAGAHLEGLAATIPGLRIGDPTVDGVGRTIPSGAEL